VNGEVDVLVVGAGPAGLAAAVELRRLGVGRVLAVDREAQAGGVPRHTGHTGFGLRDLHRCLGGPRYAAAWVARARTAGVRLRTATTVTGWAAAPAAAPGPPALELTGPDGLATVTARAVLLATGCRERPRPARLVPGTRPLGVLTTGALQQLVHLHHQPVGQVAVVVGAEHVSFSALLTLAHAGASVAAVVTEAPRHQTFAALRAAAAVRWPRTRLLTATRVSAILGRRRVEAVELTDLATGTAHRLACDTVVFTGDWVPDHELARTGGLAMDPGTRGPLVDQRLRTSVPGVFAAGNLLHGAETADVAALDGRHAAAAIRDHLAGAPWPARPPLPLACLPPLCWAAPGAVAAGAGPPPMGRLVLRTAEPRERARLQARQGGRVLATGRARRLVPNRSISLPAGWLSRVDPDGGPLSLGVIEERRGTVGAVGRWRPRGPGRRGRPPGPGGS
jgi:thioredoxin reductase